jgi:hypothetical protein
MVQIGDKSIAGNAEDVLSLIDIEVVDIYEIDRICNFIKVKAKPFLQYDPLYCNTYKKRFVKINNN